MKIEKVIIQNLNSIENAEINFSKGVLAEEPLFLICGETGSGKSTVLDAITLALYDKSPRYENIKNKEKTEDGNTTTESTTNILRKGKNDGKSEVYFSVKNKLYVATWQMHKTRNKTYDRNNRRKLEEVQDDLRIILSSTVNDVNKRIEDLIGLSYNQFVRSVMLAQGQFNTFLISEKSKQAEILEMLTGTEIYSKIAESVKNKKNEAQQIKNNIETLYKSIQSNVLSDEEIENLQVRKAELESKIEEEDKEIKKIDANIAWMEQDSKLRKEWDNAILLYDNALKGINSAAYLENKKLLNDYFKTTEVRNNLKDKQRLETDISQIDKQFEVSGRQFSNLLASFQKIKNEKDALKVKLLDLQQWMDAQKSNEEMFKQIDLIINALIDAGNSLEEKDKYEKDLMEKQKVRNNIQNSLPLLLEKVQKTEKERLIAEEAFNQSQKEFEQIKYDDLLAQRDKLDSERKNYVDRKSLLEQVKMTLEQFLPLKEIIDKKSNKLVDLKCLLKQEEDTLKQADSEFQTKDSEFQRHKTMVEDWAKEYRSKLKDAEPCPVCGSIDHPFKKDEKIINSLMDSIEIEWKNKKKALDDAKDKINKTLTEIKLLNENIESDKSNLTTLTGKLNRLCKNNPVFKVEIIVFNINKINELIDKSDKDLAKVNQKLSDARNIQKEFEWAQKNKLKAEEALHVANQQMLDRKNEIFAIETEIKEKRTSIVYQEEFYNKKKSIANEHITIPDWQQEWERSKPDFLVKLKKLAQQWNQKQEELKDINRQVVDIQEIEEQCEKYKDLILSLMPQWIYLIADHPDIEMKRLIPLFSGIFENAKERLEKKKQIEKQIFQLKFAIDDFIKSNPSLTLERLIILNKISDIQEITKEVRLLEDKKLETEKAADIIKKNLEYHRKSEDKPNEDTTLDDLKARRESLDKEEKLKKEDITNIKTRLAVSNQNNLKSIDLMKDFEEKERIFHLWEQLAKAIGTTQGDNFRDVAQAYTMSILLDRANIYMKQLSSRYLLTCYSNSLAIMVQDLDMGGEKRSASSLSGGETFLVSLALALGLASLNDKNLDMDMLFIDEGFGTLDIESLDMVMNTLENLHHLGRRVGIISHVETLKDRIPAQIQLIKEGKSASRVEVKRV